jgi:hypothetical protein
MPAILRKKPGKEEREKAGADTRKPVFVSWAKDDTAMYRAYAGMIVSKNNIVWIGLRILRRLRPWHANAGKQ